MIKKIIIITFLLFVLNPVLVYAQPAGVPPAASSTTTATTGLPEYSGVESSIKDYLCTPSEPADGKDLERCINRLYRFGITIGAIALVLIIVFAGYMYITGGETGKGKAKGMIMNALVGMAILLGSFVLLYFINPSLVAFRPIQPPIFDAADLPSCEEIGFEDDCLATDEDAAADAVAPGTKIACPDGVINFEKSVVPSSGSNTTKICKSLMEKLKQLHAKHKITVTSTIRDANAESLCHRSGNQMSGTCADLVTNSGDWAGLCKAVKEVGGLLFINESATSGSECGRFVKTKYWSGAHLHVMLGSGGGSSSSGSSNCSTTASLPGVCAWSGADPYKLDWGTNAELKSKFDAFNSAWRAKGGVTLYALQAFRPQNYTNHIRSIWEANQLVNKNKTASQIASQGYGCSGRKTAFITDTQAKAYTSSQKSQLAAEVSRHGSNGDTPPACASDHEKGIAVDISTSASSRTVPSNYTDWIGTAVSVGLCHNIAGDEPHFALKASLPSNTNCSQR
jgi:hypothetical protein